MTTTPRILGRPPISEALVDIQAAVTAAPEVFESLGKELEAEYPRKESKRLLKAEVRMELGKVLPPIAQDLGFHGVWLYNSDETAIVQFRPNGFTFNNLKKYMGGDRLLAE